MWEIWLREDVGSLAVGGQLAKLSNSIVASWAGVPVIDCRGLRRASSSGRASGSCCFRKIRARRSASSLTASACDCEIIQWSSSCSASRLWANVRPPLESGYLVLRQRVPSFELVRDGPQGFKACDLAMNKVPMSLLHPMLPNLTRQARYLPFKFLEYSVHPVESADDCPLSLLKCL